MRNRTLSGLDADVGVHSVDEVREAFLAAGANVVELVASPAVGANWLRPSVLDGWPVSTLCGHVARGATTVMDYLGRDAPAADATRLGPADYFVAAIEAIAGDTAVSSGIAARGAEAAAGGQFGVVDLLERCLDRLAESFETEAADRAVSVFAGIAMSLDDYLVTRMIELRVHSDDLAVSIGVDPPAMPVIVDDLVTHTLVDVARRRHGEAVVLRALARDERAAKRISAFG